MQLNVYVHVYIMPLLKLVKQDNQSVAQNHTLELLYTIINFDSKWPILETRPLVVNGNTLEE